jgi:hypothetical protein
MDGTKTQNSESKVFLNPLMAFFIFFMPSCFPVETNSFLVFKIAALRRSLGTRLPGQFHCCLSHRNFVNLVNLVIS